MCARIVPLLIIASLISLAAGCYDPAVPTAAYLCNPVDKSCPRGQHCTCGLCVASDDQAACEFKVRAITGGAASAVGEHQAFALSVEALEADGTTVASGFSGPVTLSSRWGDVTPNTITVASGQASAMVSLNRETLPPQTATITANFAGNRGVSNKIAVAAPPFVRDGTPIAPPPSSAQPFGFADVSVAQPDVHKTSGGWRMYFGGVTGATYKFGVATSSDGKSFVPMAAPIFAAGGAPFDQQAVNSPSVFTLSDGSANLAFSAIPTSGGEEIGLATSPDGLMPFTLANGSSPIIKRTDCGFCSSTVSSPAVLADPSMPLGDGGTTSAWLMFFSGTAMGSVAIGRATSTDGIHFTPEPAPVLSGDVSGEAVLLAPHVLVDGSVYKMWYSFARLSDFRMGDLCLSTVGIGYATSSDGFYWIRSPSNPVMRTGGSGWDAATTAFLVGSVVPADGVDPHNGVVLYYSTYRTTTTSGGPACLPNGIGRATRP